MSAKKEQEIADALNTALKCNLHGAIGSGALTELITEYFCTPDECDDTDSEDADDSSGSETDFNGGEDHGTTDVVSSLFEEAELSTDIPVVSVDEVSNIVMMDAVNSVVCVDVDDEMERVKAFTCGCHRLCFNQLTQDVILRRRLDM